MLNKPLFLNIFVLKINFFEAVTDMMKESIQKGKIPRSYNMPVISEYLF